MLLVGDGIREEQGNPDIPLFRGWAHPAGGIAWSDYYYSLLSGNDNYPEVSVGRFNVANINETIMVNKHFKYERNIPIGWNSEKVLLVAHKEEEYTECKRWIEDNVLEVYSIPFDTAYGGAESNYATNQFVKNKINAGIGLVNYRGHGLIYEWVEWNRLNESFTTKDIRSLNNIDYLPIVLNIACSNGAIQQGNYESLVEAWTLYSGGGGVSALGATRVSYTDPNHDFDKEIFRKIYNERLNIGNAINAGKIFMINNHSSWGLCNARIYILDGDPTLWVWTESPKNFSVTHPEIAEPGSNFPVNVKTQGNPVQNALVCLYKEDELQEIQYTDVNGNTNFVIPSSIGGELMYVTVSKPNFIPYEGEVVTGLNPPTNLSATSSYPYTSVTLTWDDNSNHEDGYEIYRKGINENWRKIDEVGANVTSYTDNSVSQFQDYYYKVIAKAGNVYSSFSNEKWVTTSPVLLSKYKVDEFYFNGGKGKKIIYRNGKLHCV